MSVLAVMNVILHLVSFAVMLMNQQPEVIVMLLMMMTMMMTLVLMSRYQLMLLIKPVDRDCTVCTIDFVDLIRTEHDTSSYCYPSPKNLINGRRFF
jgi:hypothetical protein